MSIMPKRNIKNENPKIDKIFEASIANPVFFAEDHLNSVNSSKVGFYMDSSLVFVSSSCNGLMLRNLLKRYEKYCIAILHNNGKVIGIVIEEDLDREQNVLADRSAVDVAIPWSEVDTVNFNDSINIAVKKFDKNTRAVVVLHKNRPVGILRREDVMGIKGPKKEKKCAENNNTVFRKIIEHSLFGLVILDKNQNIIYSNKQVLNLLQKRQHCIKGKKFEWVFGNLFGKNHREFLAGCPVNKVIETLSPLSDVERKTVAGQTFLINCYPIVYRKSLKYIVINIRDITSKKNRENDVHMAYDELTRAFRLVLPNTQFEKRLKSIPEYKDYFDHDTGLVKIIEIIPDGAYRHVVNCLKIASDLYEKGIFNIFGVDRNTIVQTLITHDIGKSQPRLNVGDSIDPGACFLDGKVHARESAKIISKFPHISTDVINLVQFHHHGEDELPEDFPAQLLPMLRLVKLIDGLSAGLTRKNTELGSMVEGSKIIVFEKNSHPRYNGIQEVDILSGKSVFHRLAIKV